MAVLNTISYEDMVDLIDREFLAGWDSIDQTMLSSGIVKSNYIGGGKGNTKRRKETLSTNEYAPKKPEGTQFKHTDVQQGYYKDTVSTTYGVMVTITLEARHHDKTEEYDRAISQIRNQLPQRMDLNLSQFFGEGLATSYVDQDGDTIDISTGDGLSLWNTAHTLTGSATTYRNILATNPQFSETALESMEDMIRTNVYNNQGEQMSGDCDVLWTTDDPVTVNAVKRLLQATGYVGTTNPGPGGLASLPGGSNHAAIPNTYQSKYKHVVLKRVDMSVGATGVVNKDLAKSKFWGLACSKKTSFYHDVFMEPQFNTPAVSQTSGYRTGEDTQTLDWYFSAVGMWDDCIVSANGLYFSQGNGQA